MEYYYNRQPFITMPKYHVLRCKRRPSILRRLRGDPECKVIDTLYIEDPSQVQEYKEQYMDYEDDKFYIYIHRVQN